MPLKRDPQLQLRHLKPALLHFRSLLGTGGPGARSAVSLSNLARFAGLWWNEVVVGFGVAEKRSAGTGTGELCIRFYVTRKLPKKKLKSGLTIPTVAQLRQPDGSTARIVTDVIELSRPPVAHRTVPSTSAVGHFIGLDGTLGLAVADTNQKRYALTCAHVAAPHWVPDLQDDPIESPPDGDRQPGVNVMGTLHDWTELDPNGLNTVDAALVAPKEGVQLSNAPLNLGANPAFANLRIGEYAKLGNRPLRVETQRGTVNAVMDAIHNELKFEINHRQMRFADVFSYRTAESKTQPGDSGAAVIDNQTRLVLGLHFAGSTEESIGYAITSRNINRAFPALGLRPL